jgi:DNA modification methylase
LSQNNPANVNSSNTTTIHKIFNLNSCNLSEKIENESVDLIVTSPPYPMIEMWDEIFSKLNPDVETALQNNEPNEAFELMHMELDKIWAEIYKVLKTGGFVCINIGDATRTIDSRFALYSSHTRIIDAFRKLGMTNLPNIIWRKQTNAPNKFMGSGMLPAGAYVTLEHEWILIFRKDNKRVFKTENDKFLRQQSSFFWEERNIWFSDIWEIKGTKQKVENSKSRERSAAFPIELAYRLINMYSVKGDTVLDPFGGTGTTQLASVIAERNSIGIDIDEHFVDIANSNFLQTPVKYLNEYVINRVKNHIQFISARQLDPKKGEIKHFNEFLNLPVMTAQEKNLTLSEIDKIESNGEGNSFFKAYHSPLSMKNFRAK